ncbi:MAG TPA: hypothetical protein VF547_12165 [Allosphingosinicella sp.]|jgi:hypothetical protein
MEAISPVFAALGVSGFDALDDLAGWLDGGFEPATAPGQAARVGRWDGRVPRTPGLSAEREG